MEAEKKITLISSDLVNVEISAKALQRSALVKEIIEGSPNITEVSLNQVNGRILIKIKEYLEHYEKEEPKEIGKPLPNPDFKECVGEWDFKFIKLDLDTIIELISGANYMGINPLLELASAKFASLIKNKSIEEIIKDNNITNELTNEEKQQIAEEDKWCMENL